MAFVPIPLGLFQGGYFTSGRVLKAELGGTSTVTPMYSGKDGGGASNKVIANSDNLPTISGSVVFPYIDDSVADFIDYIIYPDEASADLNTGALQIFANVPNATSSNSLTSSANISYLPFGGGAASSTVQAELRNWVHATATGATFDGATNDYTALQALINDNLGRKIFFPDATTVIESELLIPYSSGNRTQFIGQGSSNIRKITPGGCALRVSASYCVFRDMTFSSDSISTGTDGVRVAPESEGQVLSLTAQDYNTFDNCEFRSLENALIFRTGPDIGGSDSSCYYNFVVGCRFLGTNNRGIYLTSHPTDTNSSPANRNSIIGCKFNGTMNTGVDVESADTTRIIDCDFESINNGTSPNAAPVAIYIQNSGGASSLTNENTNINSCTFEANTNDIINENASTIIIGCNNVQSKTTYTAFPLINLGGVSYTNTTQVLPGYIYQEGSLISGYASNKIAFIKDVCDSDGTNTYQYQTYGISASNTDQLSGAADVKSYYVRVGFFVKWHVRMKFTGAGGNTGRLRIETPVNPFSVGYTNDDGGCDSMRFIVIGDNGTTEESIIAKFSTDDQNLNGSPYIEIQHSSTWATSSINFVYFTIEYRGA